MLRESNHKIAETRIYVLNPGYVTEELSNSNDNSLWRASWLFNFDNNSSFNAFDRNVNDLDALRGVRRVIAEVSRREVTNRAERSDLNDAPKKEVPQAPRETGQEDSSVITLERMLKLSRDFVSGHSWPVWKKILRKIYKQ